MKIKHPINAHKGLTAVVVLGMMACYSNFSTAPWIYLALHGGYGILWLLKDRIYPDKSWEEEVSWVMGVITFLLLSLYWVSAWLLISRGVQPPDSLLAAAVCLNILGVFLHFGSDSQKYFTLKNQPGLITDGFFARTRNPNYLGELLIYSSFALLSLHWLPFVILAGFVAGIFVPNILRKDKSLSRYPEFETYRLQSGLLLPKLFYVSGEHL